MKRKIRLSALVAVMVLMLALLIGGLYGYFDDTETSTGNVFTAGTLNLVAVTDGDATCNFTPTAGGDGAQRLRGLSERCSWRYLAPSVDADQR